MALQARVPTIDDLRVKLCYICREEEHHDAPGRPSRAWTHPCRCTLVAHEACLLQWIQSSQQSRSRAPNALKCPQCGSPYVLESDNPLALRLLNLANASLSAMGKIVTVASFTVVVVSVGSGIYILCTAYGAYALQEFLGPEMFDLLLSEDPANWPWHSFVNLPLVPLSLILSRLQVRTSISPLVPLLLAWPTSAPVRSNNNERIVLGRWGSRDLFRPLPNWPPPPLILGLFVFPAIREAYKRLLGKLTRWALDSALASSQDMQRALLRVNDEEPFLRIRVNANVDGDHHHHHDGGGDVLPRGPQQDVRRRVAALPDPDLPAPDVAAAAENTIRVSGTSFGRLVGGALIVPRISSFMGSLLLRLSRRSSLLKRLLAVRPPLPSGTVLPVLPGVGVGAGAGAAFDGKTWSEMSLLKRMGYVGYLGLTVAWRGTVTWAECDPVWWRNSLGLGLFVVAKDCVHLLHLWLTKRELESRRVKNRSFEGVDPRELDLIVRS